MSDTPGFGLHQKLSQQQVQIQTQKMSQQQILSLKMLNMSNMDLRKEIYSFVEKNPALEITRDMGMEGVKTAHETNYRNDDTRSMSVSQSGQLASDNFQAALEASPDSRKSLAEHLEHQFLSVQHTPSEEALGLKLIYNLDSKGHHILAPVSLLDSGDSNQNEELLNRLIFQINQLDPVGCCCSGFEESLLIQAKLRGDASDAVLFILDGHFEFLNPPQPSKILRKINDYLANARLEEGNSIDLKKLKFNEEQIEKALEYIRTLDPYPAREYSEDNNRYIQADVNVKKDEETGLFTVEDNFDCLPQVRLSRDFESLAADRSRVTKSTEESEKKRSEHRFVMESVRDAKQFMENLEYRKRTVLLACRAIVDEQQEFFEKGKRYLKPLRQKDIAKKIGVHEATISRMANGKYLRCSQGLFPISFFFSNAVSQTALSSSKTVESGAAATSPASAQNSTEVALSRTAVMAELQAILAEHANDKKALSDSKLCALLEERNIKIARRTVAKYRAQLNIDSSYTRKL